jgi:hypothetical protein
MVNSFLKVSKLSKCWSFKSSRLFDTNIKSKKKLPHIQQFDLEATDSLV